MTIVTLSKSPDHPAVVLHIARILRVDQPGVNRIVVLPLPVIPHHLPVPGRYITPLISSGAVCRYPEHQLLSPLMSCSQRLVDQFPVILSHLRLHVLPIDTVVGDRGLRIPFVLEVSVKLLILDRESLCPAGAGIELIAIAALKCGEVLTWVVSQLVRISSPYHKGIQLLAGYCWYAVQQYHQE